MDVVFKKYLLGLEVPSDFKVTKAGLKYIPTCMYLVEDRGNDVFFNHLGLSTYLGDPCQAEFYVCGVLVKEGEVYPKKTFLKLWT